jgi:hypothetical protein
MPPIASTASMTSTSKQFIPLFLFFWYWLNNSFCRSYRDIIGNSRLVALCVTIR